MIIWLQKSASIQKRTGPDKFDHFAEKFGQDAVPYLCTKAGSSEESSLLGTGMRSARFSMDPSFFSFGLDVGKPMKRGENTIGKLNGWVACKLNKLKRPVLFCIEADFCVQIRILQHFSRSTRLTFLCTG